jgi:hypothetical protein
MSAFGGKADIDQPLLANLDFSALQPVVPNKHS